MLKNTNEIQRQTFSNQANEKKQPANDRIDKTSDGEEEWLSLEDEQEEFNAVNVSPDEIKIYLAAAADEFQEEIETLKQFIEEQNRCQNAVRLKLQCYEGIEKQNIEECKYCYILVGGRAEKWIWETYELARRKNSDGSCFSECETLRLFFKKASEEEADLADKSRTELENRYREDFKQEIFYFRGINRIKLDILQNLRKEASDVSFSEETVSQFQKNAVLEPARMERNAWQAEYKKAADAFHNGDQEAKKRLDWVEKKFKDQDENVKRMEKAVWDNMDFLTDRLQNASAMDEREAEAVECVIEYGDYEKAESLLRSEEWKGEISYLEQAMDEQKARIKQYISSQRSLISILRTRADSSSEKEINKIYTRITALSKKWQIEYITLYEYAEFLLDQKKYKEGIAVGEHLKCLHGLSDDALCEDKAKLLKLLGKLYFQDNDYKKSERAYREATETLKEGPCENQELVLETWNNYAQLLWKKNQLYEAEGILRGNVKKLEKLVESDPKTYEPILAFTYHLLGTLASRGGRLEAAKEYYFKAVKIRECLAEKNSSYNVKEKVDLTITYNNLGFLFKKMEEYNNANIYYKKSIEIRRQNAKRNPSLYRPSLALAYSNYATLLDVKDRNHKAQEFCNRSLVIRRELVKENPSYKTDLAYTLDNYGVIMGHAHEYVQAEKYLKEAIEIREELTENDEAAHRLQLAESYRNYGELLFEKGKIQANEKFYREAEKNFEKALKYFQENAEENKGCDLEKLANAYQLFGELLNTGCKKYEEAEKYYRKAAEGWKKLSEQCQPVYGPKLQKAEKALKELKFRV